MKINIAIDGPSAAGKSTIAKQLAHKLGYVHLDTGAMYRCVAYIARNHKLALDDEEGICNLLKDTSIEITKEGKVFLNDTDVSDVIRSEENSIAASDVSKLKKVREDLVHRQKMLAARKGMILDGRDIGTVVLPDAEVKVYMSASPRARARRRYEQDRSKGIQTGSIDDIAQAIEKRDRQDMTRSESPLRKADDAIYIDTSDMTVQEVVDTVYKICMKYIKED